MPNKYDLLKYHMKRTILIFLYSIFIKRKYKVLTLLIRVTTNI